MGGKCWYGTILSYLRLQDINIRRTGGYSYACIKWLGDIEQAEGIKIQHALTQDGEYHIPGTPFKADGYHATTNTIYEYYGDIYHGNPLLFLPDDQCHPFSSLTSAQLYKNTINREETIRALGYNIITMWEYDWLNNRKNL